ncbi:hypothetical protein KF840_25850 [bacterium]|nr:hypothetical protein [bacterium]
MCATALLSATLAGCLSSEYVGRSYAPTSHVDVYFDAKDVSRPYTVMGEVRSQGDEIFSFDRIQKELVEKAQAEGADGVIILGTGRERIGTSTKTDTQVRTTETSQLGVDDSGNLRGTTVTAGGVTTTGATSDINVKVVTGQLIKYTK